MNQLDWTVVILYLIAIVGYGLWLARKAKSSDDYFRGGRKFKWWTMMGQAFGTGTHAEMPVAQAGATFQMGFAAIWYQWKNLLVTPFYWLMAPWYRRSERTTVAEMVTDRYGRQIGLIYTIFAIAFFVFIMGAMLQGAAKVIAVAAGSDISPNAVVLAMTIAFVIYSYFGGLVAAAHTEFIQGLLIILLSFMLIPFGLQEIGGFDGMRSSLSEDFFQLYNEEVGLGAFMIAMLMLNGVVGITAQPHMMSMFATGNTERAGRIGQTYGNFVKRLITIGWALTGMIVAVVVMQQNVELPDPEHAFGFATRELLAPGLSGLMIACILAANMSSCSNFMVNLGALFTKDIYQPYIRPQASDNEILRVGKLSGLLLTLSGVLFALIIENVLQAFLFTETIAAFMGIMVFGGILWKGANRYGANAAVGVAFLLYYWLNFQQAGELQLIYKWQPEPFGWAMLTGFSTLIIVSLLTRTTDPERAERFFEKMRLLSEADTPEKVEGRANADNYGQGLILFDVSTWFTKKRWSNFLHRYREDFYGFLLAWSFVFVLIGLAWLILQIK